MRYAMWLNEKIEGAAMAWHYVAACKRDGNKGQIYAYDPCRAESSGCVQMRKKRRVRAPPLVGWFQFDVVAVAVILEDSVQDNFRIWCGYEWVQCMFEGIRFHCNLLIRAHKLWGGEAGSCCLCWRIFFFRWWWWWWCNGTHDCSHHRDNLEWFTVVVRWLSQQNALNCQRMRNARLCDLPWPA